MSRVFEPVISTYLLTDGKNHDDVIEYKLSYGFENENYKNPIFKVQMIGEGKIKGRQAPSYSDGDFDKIISIRPILKKEFTNMDNRIRDAGISIDNISTSHSRFSK